MSVLTGWGDFNRRFQSLKLCWDQSDTVKTFISTKFASLYYLPPFSNVKLSAGVHCGAYVTMVMQEVNQLCKTENPELTLKLLCHSQILLHSPGPSFSSRGSTSAACGLKEEIIVDTLHTERELLQCTLLYRVNELVFFNRRSGFALHRLSSVSISSILVLLSIRWGCKQFVCEAFWIYKMSGDQSLPHKLRL